MERFAVYWKCPRCGLAVPDWPTVPQPNRRKFIWAHAESHIVPGDRVPPVESSKDRGYQRRRRYEQKLQEWINGGFTHIGEPPKKGEETMP
ncbi:hypothetical protein [Kyrpidia spormannii]|nr:hypothetical protein [Kyrpidia spormannii]